MKLTEAKLMLQSFYVKDSDIVLSQQFFILVSPSSLVHDSRLITTAGEGTNAHGWCTTVGAEFYTFTVKVLPGHVHAELDGMLSFQTHIGNQFPRDIVINHVEAWIRPELMMDA